jgi:hypothetical protein
VLGGYAVIYYGYRRTTDDFDVWIAPGRENAERVSRVMQLFAGFPASQVKPSLFQQEGKVFIFGREPTRIDVLTSPSGLDFDACYERRNIVRWDGVPVSLLALEDLRANKTASGRAKDIDDLEHLPLSMAQSKRSKKRRRRQE